MAARFGLAGRVNDGNVKWFTLVAACFGLFMAILDNLVVNIAMPTIAVDLDATTTHLQWIVSAYTIVFASLQITAGGLGDRFGRKRWFMLGLVLFTATSLLAALSRNIEMLIAMRALQGLGAAFIMPLSLSLISAAFPPEERGKAVGIWGAISVSSIALGPVVGGLLVEYASWEWVFLINVPIGLGALFVTSAVVRESKDESGAVSTDIPGTVLITAAIAALTYGLIEAGERGWGDTRIVTFLVGALALGIAFIYVESRTALPMVPLRFFRSKTFTGANIDSFMIAFLLTGISFFMTLYQQNVHGFSAVRTGLALLPMVAVMMALSPIAGSLTGRMGSRTLLSIGLGITAIGTLLFLRSGADASYWDILPAFIVLGLGNSFLWAPMTTAVLNSVESDKSGIASAVNGAVREIGTAFGIALLGTIANRVYQNEFRSDSRVEELAQNPELAPVVSFVGDGASNAGHVIDRIPALSALPAEVVDVLRLASSEAFVVGMDRAIIISGLGLLVTSVLSYFLISEQVVVQPIEAHAPAPALEPEVDPEVASAPAAD
ncbi:MAG TPA: MFS transporter [Thermomicrobiales bacterium]